MELQAVQGLQVKVHLVEVVYPLQRVHQAAAVAARVGLAVMARVVQDLEVHSKVVLAVLAQMLILVLRA